IEKGFFQKEIARAAYQYQNEIENGDRYIVGVNKFQDEDEKIEIPILEIGPEVEKKQRDNLKKLRAERDNKRVQNCLAELKHAAQNDINLMPKLVECAHAYATVGEMINTLKEVFGEYVEPAEF
ncbi:MAG TPA: methylmalonyl-CoA mutase, partial [Caldithrix abyssi]|nr:methylmalonyl-CoA mutase [Caldithrix abyssi]